jgi:hypothetical protein
MDNGNNFDFTSNTLDDFIDNLNTEGHQWESYTSIATSSSGEGFPTWQLECIHHWRANLTTVIQSIVTKMTSTLSQMQIWMVWVTVITPTWFSQYGSQHHLPLAHLRLLGLCQSTTIFATYQSVLTHPLQLILILDTANILPIEHCRKRIKSARVRQWRRWIWQHDLQVTCPDSEHQWPVWTSAS